MQISVGWVLFYSVRLPGALSRPVCMGIYVHESLVRWTVSCFAFDLNAMLCTHNGHVVVFGQLSLIILDVRGWYGLM